MTPRVRKIKALDEHHIHILRELHDATFADDAPIPDWFAGEWWLARDKWGIPVGFAGLQPAKHHKGWGYMVRVGVLPLHRRMGLHRKFIQARLKRALKLGYAGLVTDTTENDQSANNLIAAGFKLYTPKHPWGYKHSLYWRMEL